MNYDLIKKIIILGRPHILIGNLLLYIMGAMLAILFNADFVLNKFILGYSILFTAHLGVHYSNDYFDVEVDRHNPSNMISKGRGLLVENPNLRELSRVLAISLAILSLILAAIFTIIYNYTILYFLFFLFGNLLAWFYTAPPVKLVYRRMGEVANIIALIIFLGAGYFTLMGTLNLPFIIFAVPLIFFQIIFINSFEIPDMEGDEIGGKITWIVSWGREFGFKLILISASLATLSFLLIPLTGLFPKFINFQVIVGISLITLCLGIIELLEKPFERNAAIKYATINVIALFVMSILIDGYFLFLIVT